METAKLHWFDVSSGEGMVVRDSDGKSLYLHYTCIAGIAKNGYVAPTAADQVLLGNLRAGDACRITTYSNLYSERVETCDFTPAGVVDA